MTHKTLKVIMVTGADLDAETKAAIAELGVSDYLHKPIATPALNAALIKVLA
jgi:DNA-binding response OmpR family regulator